MKKAQFEIKALIFFLIVLIILLSIFAGLLHRMPFVGEQKRCESYVTLASTLKNPFTKQTRVNLNKACPTKDVEIRARGSQADIQNNAFDDILSEMYQCGKTWGFSDGEIKKNPFNQWNVDNVCVVCSELKFDASLKSKGELAGFLERQTKSIIPESSDKTFYQFFTGSLPTPAIDQQLKNFRVDGEEYKIDPNKDYYIIYAVNMRTTPEGFLARMGLGTITGIGLTAILGSRLAALRWMVIGFTTLTGAYIGANVQGQSYASWSGGVPTTDGALLLVPIRSANEVAEDINSYCKTLGVDPLGDPWSDEFDE
ncbi:MAG: hypothetical protein ABIJ08_00525 [Nanoarchaeota archaeon]